MLQQIGSRHSSSAIMTWGRGQFSSLPQVARDEMGESIFHSPMLPHSRGVVGTALQSSHPLNELWGQLSEDAKAKGGASSADPSDINTAPGNR